MIWVSVEICLYLLPITQIQITYHWTKGNNLKLTWWKLQLGNLEFYILTYVPTKGNQTPRK